MSSHEIKHIRCDRCGVRGEIKGGYDSARDQWGTMTARHMSAELWLGGATGPQDICETCASELAEWWHAGLAQLGKP